MTDSEPSGSQLAEDDTALLTAALDHTWAWYDGRISRSLQVISFYLVAAAITGSAYTSAITGKHYSVATAIAVGGLGLTAVASGTVFREVSDATRAEPVLAELQRRVGSRLGFTAFRMASAETPVWYRRVAVNITIVLAILFNISALVYAATR
jgi:hypothetical protein